LPSNLLAARQRVAELKAQMQEALADRRCIVYNLRPSTLDAPASAPPPDLSCFREREILAFIADGQTISMMTVRNLVSNIFSKLQVADREAGLGGGTDAASDDDFRRK
jgi:DNA-binding NarL/FixJ family response regulator